MDLAELICEIIKESGRDISKVKISHTKAYTNITFFNFPYIRVKMGPKSKYIAIPNHLNYMLSFYGINATESGGWYRINLNNADDVYKLSKLLFEIFDYCCIKSVGETFGCCSRYTECSDAKACLQEHEQWSKGCSYRKNLINGKIFYGKNAILQKRRFT